MSFLKRKRRAKAFTTRSLGEFIGMPQSSVSKLENDLEILGEERAKKIGEALQIPEDVLTIYRGLLPNYAKFAYKLFPDKIEERLRKFINEIISTELKSNPILTDELKSTMAYSSDFFGWLDESDFTFCGFRSHLVANSDLDEKTHPYCICMDCSLEIDETAKKLGVSSEEIKKNSELRTFQFIDDLAIARHADPDLLDYDRDVSIKTFNALGYYECPQCLGIYQEDFFSNDLCRNCHKKNAKKTNKLEITKKILTKNKVTKV